MLKLQYIQIVSVQKEKLKKFKLSFNIDYSTLNETPKHNTNFCNKYVKYSEMNIHTLKANRLY